MSKKKAEQAAENVILTEEQVLPEADTGLIENPEDRAGESGGELPEETSTASESMEGEEMVPPEDKYAFDTQPEDIGEIADRAQAASLEEGVPTEDEAVRFESQAAADSEEQPTAEDTVSEEALPAEIDSLPFGVPLLMEGIEAAEKGSSGDLSESGAAAENNEMSADKVVSPEDTAGVPAPAKKEPKPKAARKRTSVAATPKAPARSARSTESSILTIEVGKDVMTQEDENDIIWHEIQNAYRTRKILSGTLGGIEQTEVGSNIAVVYYKGFRIVIPAKEMLLREIQEDPKLRYGSIQERTNKLLNGMMGAEIDFVVKGTDTKTRSVIASRRDAALKKRQTFYFDTDANGYYKIYEGRIVQARVVAVAEKVVRVEVFGVETSILAKDLAWGWMGDARDKYSVGDEILVCIQKVHRDSLESVAIKADVKGVTEGGQDNLSECRVQSKYAGTVTDVIKGQVYVRLSIGVNAVAHSCQDNRMPGKKDTVSFAVTRIDAEKRVAVGIITRIIRQHL